MNHKTHMKKLEQLYGLAIETKNIGAALAVIDEMFKSCFAEAGKKEATDEV